MKSTNAQRNQMQKEKPTIIECQTCGWEGPDDVLVAPTSAMEPGCPSCYGTDFLEVEE